MNAINASALAPTYEIAMAAGRDAGNASMRAAGRAAWALEDLAEASHTFDALWALMACPVLHQGRERALKSTSSG